MASGEWRVARAECGEGGVLVEMRSQPISILGSVTNPGVHQLQGYKVLTAYIRAAMRHARYEILEDEGLFYRHIPECPGVWATANTLESCREELESILEGWLSLGLRMGHPIPELDGRGVTSGV